MPETAARVIHTGQALVDEVLEVEALPDRGSNAVVHGVARYAASAVNTLLAAARSGAACVHAGSVGTGPNGDLVRSVLEAEGVEISAPIVPGLDTGICVVVLEASGERTFLTAQGAERHISVESLATSRPQRGDLVCVSGYSLFGRTREPLVAWWLGLDDGVRVVLDPGAPFADLDDELLGRCLARTAVWSGNADEADALARRAGGRSPRPDGEAAMLMQESAPLVAQTLPREAVVVVRDGPNGCVLHRGGRTTTVLGYPQTPVDTNGAGDVHTGVLVAELARGTDWETAARRANAAGAIKVTRRGPDTAPTRAEIDAVLAQGQPSG